MKEDTLDKVAEFLAECESYLHSWICTREGMYKPYDTRHVRQILLYLVAGGSKTPIQDFKQGVIEGKILIGTFCMGLAEQYKEQLYKRHREIVKNFEEKYHITDEKDKQQG